MPVLDHTVAASDLQSCAAPPDVDLAPIVTLYFTRLAGHLRQHFDVDLDRESAIRRTLRGLHEFLPPRGALVIAGPAGTPPVGFGLVRTLRPGTGELTRIFLAPEARGRGLGRALAERLLADAAALGHRRLLLCSSGWQVPAHRLYRSLGFREIGPYPECEPLPGLAPYMMYMQRNLGHRIAPGGSGVGPT